MNTRKNIRSSGFTLIELLTVIAIIGILAAILFPVVGKVRESAGETAIRAQFSQWGQAAELFRQDYGFYPDFGDSGNDLYVNRASQSGYDGDRFFEALTGRKAAASGGRIEEGDDGYEAGNTRAASFYTFAEEEIERNGDTVIIRDRSGNADIVVLFDRTQNGIIEFGGTDSDYATTSLPSVWSANSGMEFQPTIGDDDTDTISSDGVRANVIFYSAGYGNRLLTSWE